MSQMETFDPKPELNKWAGKTIAESPYKAFLDSPYLKKNLREFIEGLHKVHPKIYQMQVDVPEMGPERSGDQRLVAARRPPVPTTWPSSARCGPPTTITARSSSSTPAGTLSKGSFPTIGSWVHYGLGTLNDNLPQFVVMGTPIADCCGGVGAHGANYLGPEHNGVQLAIDPKTRCRSPCPGADVYREEQQEEFALLGRLNRLAAVEYPDDPAMQARIKSYELAFHMQSAVPDVVDFAAETEATQKSYGLDRRRNEAVRRAVPGRPPAGRAGSALRADLSRLQRRRRRLGRARRPQSRAHALCKQVDQPIGGLIKDLKQRGLLDETLVVIGTEFGRTPGAQGSDGRDHHPYGFSVVLAGGGLKGGSPTARPTSSGFHAVENRHYVTDLHATVLHQLGLDAHRLEIPGRKRLEVDFGQPIGEIIA